MPNSYINLSSALILVRYIKLLTILVAIMATSTNVNGKRPLAEDANKGLTKRLK